MIIKCKICDIHLTNPLIELEDKLALNETDGEDHIRAGFYYISDGEFYTGSEGKIIINEYDLINSKNHPNRSRLNGCCGLDGLDGLNKVCINGHEIATEKSDCWMPHAMIFESDLILVDKSL